MRQHTLLVTSPDVAASALEGRRGGFRLPEQIPSE